MGAQLHDSWLLDAQPKNGLLRGFASVSMRTIRSVVLPLSIVFLFAIMAAGKQLFCGFLRDLSERGRSETAPEPQGASSQM